jgi:hypothetical protein
MMRGLLVCLVGWGCWASCFTERRKSTKIGQRVLEKIQQKREKVPKRLEDLLEKHQSEAQSQRRRITTPLLIA